MKTREELVAEDYPEDWACECVFCGSWNCHEYADCVFCFDCKRREKHSVIKKLRKKKRGEQKDGK